MKSKKWSYDEITAHTENSIKQFMQSAIALNDEVDKRQRSNWAFGAYITWYQLTTGWQNIGDNERLENLTKIENYSGKVTCA